MDHQEALGNFGSPCEIEWKGQTYKLSFFTQAMKAALVKLMKQHALKEALELAEDMPPEDRERILDGHRKDREAGKFAWGSPYHLAFQATEKGAVLLVLALFHRHPTMTYEEVFAMMTHPKKSVELSELIKIHTPKAQSAGEDTGGQSPKA